MPYPLHHCATRFLLTCLQRRGPMPGAPDFASAGHVSVSAMVHIRQSPARQVRRSIPCRLISRSWSSSSHAPLSTSLRIPPRRSRPSTGRLCPSATAARMLRGLAQAELFDGVRELGWRSGAGRPSDLAISRGTVATAYR